MMMSKLDDKMWTNNREDPKPKPSCLFCLHFDRLISPVRAASPRLCYEGKTERETSFRYYPRRLHCSISAREEHACVQWKQYLVSRKGTLILTRNYSGTPYPRLVIASEYCCSRHFCRSSFRIGITFSSRSLIIEKTY